MIYNERIEIVFIYSQHWSQVLSLNSEKSCSWDIVFISFFLSEHFNSF